MAVFAFGETLLQPTVPAIANDLATGRERGRYNAVDAAALHGGTIAAQLPAGVLPAAELVTGFVVLMVLGTLAMWPMSLALERRLSVSANGEHASANGEHAR